MFCLCHQRPACSLSERTTVVSLALWEAEAEREREAVATYNFNDNWRGGEEEEEGLKYPTITAVPPPEEAEGRRGKKRKVDAKFYDTNECLFNSVSG